MLNFTKMSKAPKFTGSLKAQNIEIIILRVLVQLKVMVYDLLAF